MNRVNRNTMVCIYTTALQFSKARNEHDPAWLNFPEWNWLIHDLTDYIHFHSGAYNKDYYPSPHIPLKDDTSEWAIWFKAVSDALVNEGEFYDTNDNLTMRALENCPSEEVALIIFETIYINIIKNYITP